MQRPGLIHPLVGIFASAILAAPAAAQSDADEIIIVDPVPPSEQARDDQRALDEPGLVTRIRVDDETEAGATLADVIARSVGAQVRQLGGLGGFASLSVRGLDPGHTPVSIDGIGLSRLAGAIADLSRFELGTFERIELYRGAAPVSITSGLGGALNLVTEVGGPARTELSTGAGSYGARHLRARHLGGDGQLGYQIAAGYAGADGDYPFFDDNGTNLDPADDTIETRSNNGFDRLDAVIRARERAPDRIAQGGARLALVRQGLPGIAARQTESAELDTASGLIDAAVEQSWPRALSTRLAGFAMFDRFHLRDPEGEVGLGTNDTVGESLSVGAGAAASRRGEVLEVAIAALDLRVDSFGERDRTAGVDGARGIRLGGRLGLQVRYAPIEAVALVPSARLELLETRPRGGDSPVAGRTDIDPAGQLAALWRPTTDVSLKASAGYAVRQPTLVELFGDRGYAAGNPMLLPERGPHADAGVLWLPADPPGPLARLFVEVAGFASRLDDAIVWFPTAGQVARPFNVSGAQIAGFEASVQAALGQISATAAYTFTDARDRDSGNPLPHRARHQVYGRLDARLWRLRGWADASYASGNVLDRANVVRLPPRTFIGAGLEARLAGWLRLSVEGKNLADEMVEHVALDPPPRPDLTSSPRAVSDFFGYPLPGRALYITARATF